MALLHPFFPIQPKASGGGGLARLLPRGWVDGWMPPRVFRGVEENLWPKLTCAEGARENFSLAEGPEKNLAESL